MHSCTPSQEVYSDALPMCIAFPVTGGPKSTVLLCRSNDILVNDSHDCKSVGLRAEWVKKPRVPSSWLYLPGVKHAVLLGLAYAAIHYSVSHFLGHILPGLVEASFFPLKFVRASLGECHDVSCAWCLQGDLQKHILTGDSRKAWEQWGSHTVELKLVRTTSLFSFSCTAVHTHGTMHGLLECRYTCCNVSSGVSCHVKAHPMAAPACYRHLLLQLTLKPFHCADPHHCGSVGSLVWSLAVGQEQAARVPPRFCLLQAPGASQGRPGGLHDWVAGVWGKPSLPSSAVTSVCILLPSIACIQ